MSETLPLFPLGTVLFPGLLLPLHIFEDRYRRLVRDLQDGPEPRRFGVIAIRQGDEAGEPAAAAKAVQVIRDLFRTYLSALAERGVTQISAPELPDEPVTLSYLVGASMIIDLSDRQALLAEPDALRRLIAERALLSRELTMLRALTATPAPDLRNSPYSSN